MATVSMQQVKELRDRTQAGLNDCKAALVETDGDMEKAVESILKKGLAKSAKRAGAVASEGEVLTKVAQDALSGVIVEVNIQTDFAARNDEFKSFARAVADVALTADTGADLGKLPYPGGSASVEETRAALVGKLGENITVRRWQRVAVSGPGLVHSYIHMGGKIGALLGVKVGDAAVLKRAEFSKFVDDVAMQIAAMSPLYLDGGDVPAADRAKQGEIFDAQLKDEGKPEAARPKIIEGKLNKWFTEVCLLRQVSVLEADKSIDQVRKELEKTLGTTVTLAGFARYQCGEGVAVEEKPDFADEARKMAGLPAEPTN
jgi:elongation factor Ts